jgi:hypothetical protein
MGPNIQNELINLCANSIRKYLLNELISQNKFYAVIADETADISGTEQLSISIRYVSEENDISIKEIFLGFTALSDLTAVGITKAIITSIKKYGLNIEQLRGMFLILIKKLIIFVYFQVKDTTVPALLPAN